MEKDWERLAAEGLAFFGKMTAAMSHDVKNLMAIINEHAGLLEDLAVLAERKGSLDPGLLKSSVAAIQNSVQRSDSIIKRINTFAHSADRPAGRIELDACVRLVADLSQRFAAVRGVALSVNAASGAFLATNPYFLENCVHLCLAHALESAGTGKSITVTTTADGQGAGIVFSGLEAPAGPFPTENARAVARVVEAGIVCDPAGKRLVISLPLVLEG